MGREVAEEERGEVACREEEGQGQGQDEGYDEETGTLSSGRELKSTIATRTKVSDTYDMDSDRHRYVLLLKHSVQ